MPVHEADQVGDIGQIHCPGPVHIGRIHQQGLRAVAEEADNYGIPLIVHATSLREAKVAVKAGARVLVHSVQDRPVDEEFIGMMTASSGEVLYMPTLTVRGGYVRMYESALTGEVPEIDDPNRCVDEDTLTKIAESAEAREYMRFGEERFESYAARAAEAAGSVKTPARLPSW